jgi:hypothetical protein
MPLTASLAKASNTFLFYSFLFICICLSLTINRVIYDKQLHKIHYSLVTQHPLQTHKDVLFSENGFFYFRSYECVY